MADAKTTWGAGEYALMARALEPVSGELVEAIGVSPGERVIDIATGTGNAALEAAARGAVAIGVDFEPSLLKLARERAIATGVEIGFVEGDAERLPIGDGEADVVVSAFGVMYALDHAAAAREIVRVLVPRGRVALAAWVPGSVMPAMGAVIASYLPPPPPASGPPGRWGDPRYVAELMSAAGAVLSEGTRVGRLDLEFEDAHAAASFLIRTAGHIVSEAERLAEQGRWRALQDDLVDFAARHGQHRDGHIVLGLDYLIAIADRA